MMKTKQITYMKAVLGKPFYQCVSMFLCLFFGSIMYASAAEPTFIVDEGKHKQALYKIVKPKNWNKKLLLRAHGGRPKAAPVSADFEIEGTLNELLLREGWMVAESSYRRNGVFVNDAILDLKDLMDFIDTKYGNPSQIYLSGASMGGKIGVQMAEEKGCRLDGVFANGAALWCQDKINPTALTYKPYVPILFFSNFNETKGPRDYLAKVKAVDKQPVLWTSLRKGHCNLNKLEKVEVIEALVRWVELGKKPSNKKLEIELARKDSTAKHVDEGLVTKAMRIHPSYGSFKLNCTRADLIKFGLKEGNHFHLTHKRKTFKVYLGHGYGDVAKGHWISFVTADDYLQIARAGARVGELLKCTKGDEIIITINKKNEE